MDQTLGSRTSRRIVTCVMTASCALASLPAFATTIADSARVPRAAEMACVQLSMGWHSALLSAREPFDLSSRCSIEPGRSIRQSLRLSRQRCWQCRLWPASFRRGERRGSIRCRHCENSSECCTFPLVQMEILLLFNQKTVWTGLELEREMERLCEHRYDPTQLSH